MTLRTHPDDIVAERPSGALGIHGSWERVRLRAIAEVLNGFAFPSASFASTGEMPLIRIRDVGRPHTDTWYSGPFDRQYVVEPGSVIVGMDGDFRADKWLGPPALLNQRVCKVTVRDPQLYSPEFLRYALPGYLDAINRQTSAVTVKHLSSETVKDLPLPLPPRVEQDRIVAAIEDQFSRLDAGLAAIERVRQNLKRLRAAVLHAAVHADESDAATRWPIQKVSDLARVTSGATPARGNRNFWKGGTIPWVTSTLVNQELITSAREFITDLAVKETSVKIMPAGTLLVAMYGEGQTRGRCSELLIEATTNQACAAIVVNPESACSPAYLKLYFKATYEANRLLSAGGVQPNLSVGTIKNLLINVPPMGEQIQIVRRTMARVDAVDDFMQHVDDLTRRQDALRSSVLAAAFSGKLVTQNPDDEPASILLKRITPDRVSANGHRPPVRPPRAARPRVPA
jgi:type I restriction enzyme, S subunit